MLDQILAIDKAIFLFINQSLSNPILDLFFSMTTHLGSILTWLFFGAFLLVIKKKKIGITVLIGTAINLILIFLLKIGFSRPRPTEALGINILTIETDNSFPSGHSAQGFLGAGILSKHYPKLIWIFYGLAFVVAIGRVYLGVHYPSDIIAGSLMGICVNLLVSKLPIEKITKKVNEFI